LPSQLEEETDTGLSDLVHRLADDGRAWARAEIAFYRELALYRVGKAKAGAIAIGIGLLLALAAPIVLLVMVAQGLAMQIGPVGAGVVVAGAAALIAVLLIRFGAAKLRALGGDAEERRAIERGERRA
jgi:hypothetical protein